MLVRVIERYFLRLATDWIFNNERGFARIEKTWGGDIENVSLELKIDGEEYILFMTCVCYDDRWYIAEFGNYYSLAGNVTPLAAGLCPKDSYRGLE